jgi:hypothetical protein
MFISISIDLVGSTAIKKAISHDRQTDYSSINTIYEQYAEIMFDVEDALYRYVSASGVIDIRQLFLIKIIGDEYWFFYEVDDGDTEALIKTAGALIDGLLKVFSKPRNFDLVDAKGTHVRFDLSTKALVDLVTNALHLPQRRFKYFDDKIMDLLGAEARAAHPDPADYAALCYGLNFRPSRPASEELLGISRSDYVGTQIDRFFRTTKACKPRLVTVGESLWDRLDFHPSPLQPGIRINQLSRPGDAILPDSCRAARETIPASEMTGINTDYTVWHLFCEDTLRRDIYRPDSAITDFLDPTRAFLARNGFYGIER